MRSSGHQMAIALMNLQHLWISAQDLCRVKPPETPAETGEFEIPCPAQAITAADGCCGREENFLGGTRPLVAGPCSSRWSDTQTNECSMWTCWVIERLRGGGRDLNLKGEHVRRHLGENWSQGMGGSVSCA